MRFQIKFIVFVYGKTFSLVMCYRYKRFGTYKLCNHVLQTAQRYITFCRIERINTKAFEMGFFSRFFFRLDNHCDHTLIRTELSDITGYRFWYILL